MSVTEHGWKAGAVLGAAWGVTEAAFNSVLGPTSWGPATAEIILSALLWSLLAAGLSLVLSRTPWRSPASRVWILSGLFMAAYLNYVLQYFLIGGVEFLSRRGLLLFLVIALVVLSAPGFMAVRTRRRERFEGGISFFLVVALTTACLFALGREYVSRLDPGFGRIAVLLGATVSAQTLLAVVYSARGAGPVRSFLRMAAPLVVVALVAKPYLVRSDGGPVHATAPPRMPPVILISLDTTRQDHLSYFGYRRHTTPALDAFLSESRVYPRAYSTSSWTLPSHASVFTGLYPKAHGAHFPAAAPPGVPPAPMDGTIPTLAAAMGERGYLTAAIASNPVSVSPHLGLSRGFGYVDTKFTPARRPVPLTLIHALRRVPQPLLVRWIDDLRPAGVMTDLAVEWIEPRRERPFFLFLNYYDPHQPYSPSRPFTAQGDAFSLGAWYHRIPHGRQSWEQKIDLYDGEILFMDRHVGRFLDYLRETGLYDRSLIVLFSDHGEFFGERGRLRGHNKNLDEAVHKIVYGVRYPGGAHAGVDSSFVNLADLWSFVDAYLDHGRVPALDYPDGPRVSGEKYLKRSEMRTRWQGGDRLVSVHWKDMKYVYYGAGGRLYDLSLDPQELRDLRDKHADADRFLFNLVEQWDAGLKVPEVIEDPQAAREAREVLKGLGYMN